MDDWKLNVCTVVKLERKPKMFVYVVIGHGHGYNADLRTG